VNNRSIQFVKLLIILLVPILVIGGSVRLLSTDMFLAYEYGKASFPPDLYDFNSPERYDLASANIHYIRAHTPDNALAIQTLRGKAVYTPREVEHMADVRAVFQAVFRVWQVALVLLLGLGLILWRQGKGKMLAQALRTGGLITSGFVLSIGLLAFFAWQMWFDLFHRFFFEAGSWLFEYSDTLIRLFPLKFWSDATFAITVLSLVGGLVALLTGWYGVAASKNTTANAGA
jgi:integral membrane protein (TIGR01906 family)